MKWSLKLGKIAGIDFYVHTTFLLLLVFVGFTSGLGGVAFVGALFTCVVLHELGHALAARRYGIPTHDITLLPIGGVARLDRIPEKPSQELWVAAAGPLVNVVIAGLLFAWLSVAGGWAPIERLTIGTGPFLERVMLANVTLVLFNLIPAFPMDGGRIARALLATRLPYVRATQIAAWLGQGLAVLMGFAGLFGNPMLMLIAVFVWIGAAQEASSVTMRSALAGTPTRAAMLTDFRMLAPGDTLADAVQLLLAGSQQDFPVVQEGRVLGIVTREDLLAALSGDGGNQYASSVMRRDFFTAEASEPLENVLPRMQESPVRTGTVTESGRLTGLLTLENLGEFVMVRAALGRSVSG